MESVTAPGPAIKGQGTSEARWQGWPPLQALPEISLARLVPHGFRAVVVAPHPDDEVLALGGMLAMLAARGDQMLVVSVTDGDASHPGSARWSPEKLAQIRHGEAITGLGQLGIEPQCCLRLSLPDGRVHSHRAQLVELLSQVLHPGDVVLSTWTADGHPDHEATAVAVAEACATAHCRHLQSPVWMWHWAVPGDSRVPWAQMCQLRLTPDAQRRKKLALLAHGSQLTGQDSGVPPVLSPTAVERMLRASEYLFVAQKIHRIDGLENAA